MTLTDRIILFIAAHPGRTAWGIAKELSDDPELSKGTISSLLNQFANKGRVRREKGLRGSWTYWPK